MCAAKRQSKTHFVPHYDERRAISLLEDDGREYKLMQDTVFTEPKQNEQVSDRLIPHKWQCVSLMRSNGTTLDLIIKDKFDMMVFLNVMQHFVYRPAL